MASYHLNKWGITQMYNNPFIPPECNPICLTGYRDDEDLSVRTSPIMEVSGMVVLTESGSTYFLDEPDPEYLTYLEEIGYSYDVENPIKDKRRNS